MAFKKIKLPVTTKVVINLAFNITKNYKDFLSDKEKIKDVLKISNKFGYSVAHAIVERYLNSKNLEILDLFDDDIFLMETSDNISVAFMMASRIELEWNPSKTVLFSKITLKDFNNSTIAHELAEFHPTWVTYDPEILSLVDGYGRTVEDILKREEKI